MHGVGPFGWFFNFADAALPAPFEPSLFWLGRRYAQPAFTQAGINSDRAVTLDAPFGALARALIFYDPLSAPPAPAATDAHYQKTHLAFFRSAWNDPQAAYLAFKGGDNQANQSHCDLGVFIFDALGERWAIKKNWAAMTTPCRATGKSTGGAGAMPTWPPGPQHPGAGWPNQDPTAAAPIIDYGSDAQHGFAVADLTQGYALQGATRVLRRVELDKTRFQLRISDQLQADRPVQVTWQFYTQAAREGARQQRAADPKRPAHAP